MLKQVFSFILILICSINASGVSATAFISEQENDSEFNVSIDSVSFDAVETQQSHGNDHQKDCEEAHKNCHQCHLGHCNFLVLSFTDLSAPDFRLGDYNSSAYLYRSIFRSPNGRPPSA